MGPERRQDDEPRMNTDKRGYRCGRTSFDTIAPRREYHAYHFNGHHPCLSVVLITELCAEVLGFVSKRESMFATLARRASEGHDMNVSTSVPRWRVRATVDVLKQSLVGQRHFGR